MRKILLLSMAAVILASNAVFADTFDNLEGITPAQKNKLSQIHVQYKQEYNSLEQKMIEYNTKISKLQRETEKSPAEIAMLSAAYERNLKTLKEQQDKLEKDTDLLYKGVLTEEQYKQYQAQKVQVEDAFSNFLQK